MSLEPLGESISNIEVTNISTHGLWLLARDRELFLSYDDFPWFKDAPIGKILNVEELTPGHFYWPDLDVDLGTESIEHPERFPLKAKETPNRIASEAALPSPHTTSMRVRTRRFRSESKEASDD